MNKLFPNYIIDINKGTIYSKYCKRFIGSIDKTMHKGVDIKDIYDNSYHHLHQVIYAEAYDLPKHLWPVNEKGKRFEIDHIIPVKNGGGDNYKNLRLVSHKDNMNNPLTKIVVGKINIGRYPTEETRKKMSEAAKGKNNPFYGKSHTEETRKKISEATKERLKDPTNHPMYNKHPSEESRKKMSEAHIGLPSGHRKQVYQYTLDGTLVGIYESMAEAEKDGFSSKQISKCCHNEKRTHKGFRWSLKLL